MISNQYIHLIVLSTVGFYIFEQITQQLEATFIMCNTYCYSHFYYWLHIFSSYSVNSFSRYEQVTITSPLSLQRVPIDGFTVYGTSVDIVGENDCRVSMLVNGQELFQPGYNERPGWGRRLLEMATYAYFFE